MNDEEMVLDGPEGQEGGSADVMERKERYWMRFLKGMVTDRNKAWRWVSRQVSTSLCVSRMA
jgi:hypothetical protein